MENSLIFYVLNSTFSGFVYFEVINSNAGDMIEDNGGRSQQPITQIEENNEVKLVEYVSSVPNK